ncbi:sperm-associated microtubule inner protein 4 [Osmerus mordax]|uniref:sperm-associated microtubule inner protein 4 n=1 Tax=Osmerus mordax TaxID=8014 RepID=UPI00350ECEE3
MASRSSQRSHHIPAVVKGHRHFSYGGAALPEERMIQVPIPKEHPYQSHISRFALFPTFHSPDDPYTGVRAASRQPLNPLIPSSAPEVTVLSKTKGGPYRNEVLEVPMTARKKAMAWPGQHGFLDHTKPVMDESQTFYPKPQKTVLPNSILRDTDMTLSERTANILHNVVKSHWITSYQMNFTGSGPANPLRMDDFHEKNIQMISGNLTPYSAQLRERSHPVMLPTIPRDGREARVRQGRRALKSTYCPPALTLAEPLNANHISTQNPELLGARSQHPDPIGKNGIAEEMNGIHPAPSPVRPGQTDRSGIRPKHLHEAGLWCETCGEEKCVCQGREPHVRRSGPQSSRATRASLGAVEKITDTDRSLALYSRQLPHFVPEIEGAIVDTREVTCYEDVPAGRNHNYTLGGNLFSLTDPVLDTNIKAGKLDSEGSSKKVVTNNWPDREFPRSISNPCIQPRPPALASAQQGRKTGRVPLGRSHSSLLELQDSFSKTEVHQRLHSTFQGATADLRLNTSTGRKHQFYGLNCYYFNN